MRDEDEIEATLIKKMHREGYYGSRGVRIQIAAQMGMASDERGKAKTVIENCASNPLSPIQYLEHDDVVCLELDYGEVAQRIVSLTSEENLPFDLKEEL